MRGLVKYALGPGNVEVRELDVPALPGDDWVLIKVKACGLCMTDIHVQHGTFRNYPPIVLGHELSGVIEKVGSKVKRFKPGERVVTECKTGSCGVCAVCQQGKANFCPDRRGPGWGINGGMADYIVMPQTTLHLIPDSLPFDVAALTEPLSCVISAMDELAGMHPGDVVFVSGCGSIGMLAAAAAKCCGASKVIISGVAKSESLRFKVAQSIGVDAVINVEKENPVERIMELTDGHGADLIVETSGAPIAISQSVQAAAILGRIVALGFTGDNHASIEWNTCIYKGLTLKNSFSSGYTSYEKAIALMSRNVELFRQIITSHQTIDEWQAAFARQAEEQDIKAMIIPADEIYAYK